MSLSKKQQGEQNRIKVMLFLAHVGYASLRQIAKAIWRRTDASALVMASRTVKWLTEQKLVVTKQDSVTTQLLIALSKKGVDWLALNDLELPDGKRHPRDWLRHAHAHRTACNSVYAILYSGDYLAPKIWSELEVRAEVSPVFEQKFGIKRDAFSIEEIHAKIPDLVLEDNDGIEWIEVENCSRSDADFEKLIIAIRYMCFVKNSKISRVHIVIANAAAQRFRIRLKEHLASGFGAFTAKQKARNQKLLRNGFIKFSRLNHTTLELEALPGLDAD